MLVIFTERFCLGQVVPGKLFVKVGEGTYQG